ncbi:BPSL0761 family protein [Ramlibacter sp. MMS24-I3-19]|uniref:BPSL0761 family protein n=1 Tax=Ramlibacter sp. MMS24-I3-19 TaxID=3416606 RepID=UPI003D05678C
MSAAGGPPNRSFRENRRVELTTPHQRTRSTLQTREFLARLLSQDAWPELPTQVRDEASRLLRHYPEAWHLSRLHDRIPEDWGSLAAVQEEMLGLPVRPAPDQH